MGGEKNCDDALLADGDVLGELGDELGDELGGERYGSLTKASNGRLYAPPSDPAPWVLEIDPHATKRSWAVLLRQIDKALGQTHSCDLLQRLEEDPGVLILARLGSNLGVRRSEKDILAFL